MSERHVPPGGRPPSSKLDEILAQIQRRWRGVRAGPLLGLVGLVVGLDVKLPLIQEVRRFEKRLLIWDGDPNQIPTKGREFIWVDTTARWRIADVKKFLESVVSEEGAQSRLDDIIDSMVRDQVSSSELVELVRSASWEVPKEEILEEVPAEQQEALKQAITRGREEITRTILAEARKIIPQYGIELVDVRIKRLDYVESVRELEVYGEGANTNAVLILTTNSDFYRYLKHAAAPAGDARLPTAGAHNAQRP